MVNSNSGIILMNLGSPDSTKTKDVRKYLNEFLMDERVIDMPFLSRFLLVRGIINPFRAPKSAHAYSEIWTDEGSPLIVISEKQKEELEKIINLPVEIAMRYGAYKPDEAFDKLLKRNPALEEVILVPMYPHYAMSSFETAAEHAIEYYKKKKYPFKLKIVKPFFDREDYINALAETVRPYLNESYDHILFSYHGVPARHLMKSDPTKSHCMKVDNCCKVASPAHSYCYRHQCIVTTDLLQKTLDIPDSKLSISFQSRLGKGWLEPFTDVRLAELPKEGVKNILVICPAFVADCLETLEEIAMRGKETFLEAGGENYKMIPCLNSHPDFIKTLKNIVNDSDEEDVIY